MVGVRVAGEVSDSEQGVLEEEAVGVESVMAEADYERPFLIAERAL